MEMEERSITFSVQMTVKEMYQFTMYHVYHQASGLIGLFLSALALANLVVSFHDLSDQGKTIMTIVGLWFTVLEPIMMYNRSKRQVKRTKSYQKPLYYEINEKGITVSQDEESQTMEWERIRRIKDTGSQYILYSSRVHAFIFPKKCLGADAGKLGNLLREYAAQKNIPVNGRMKRNR